MSQVGGNLTAKLVLTGDATGVVGAGKETEAALDRVTVKAGQAGAAGAGATAEFDAAAIALKAQTDAATAATAAVTASTGARTGEIARLKEQGAAAESTIGKVRALSAAHAEYNGTISSARALVAAKAMTEAQYAEVASAASAKLAADLAAVRVEASASGMALDRLEANLAKLGKVGGVPRGVISRTRAAAAAIPEVIEAFPLISAAAGVTAAIGILVAAEQSYEGSVGKLNVTLQAHGLALAQTSAEYVKLSGDIAKSADVSTIAGREMEASFANAHLDTSLWTKVAAMSRDYAAVLGTEIPEAADKAAENLQKPYEWAVQLTQQYGLFNQAALQHIRDLEESGQKQAAQAEVTDAWAARIKNAADQTSGFALAWRSVSTEVSNAWDAVGKSLFKSQGEKLKVELASDEATLKGALADNPNGYRAKQIKYLQSRIAEIKKELGSIDGEAEKRNTEAQSLSDMVNGMGLSTYDQKLRTLSNQRKRVLDDYAKGISATGTDGKALTQDQALAPVDREITKTKKERAEAERSLNEVEKEHYERIQELLKGAPQLIAQNELDTRTSEGRVRAYLEGSSALQEFNDQQEVAKATLPYVTALAWAQGDAHEKLAGAIARVTKEKQAQNAADNALAAMQDIDQQIKSASGYMSNALMDAKLALNRKDINDWYDDQAHKLQAAGLSWEEYHDKLDLIMGQKLANLYEEDLRNRRDWASGVIRANKDLERSNEDWASTSEGFIRGWSQTSEDAFVNFATKGKLSIGGLTDFVREQLARMVYQRYIAGTMNEVGNSVLGGIDKVFNFSGGKSAGDVLWGNGETGGSFLSGVLHGGGDTASPQITRQVPAALFIDAQKRHGGGPILGPGERPIIAKDGEWMLNEEQQAKSAQIIDRWETALNRPAVLQLPASAGAGTAGVAPKVEVHNHGEALQVASQSYDASTNTMRLDLDREVGRAVVETVRSGGADRAFGARYSISNNTIRRA